MFGEFDPKELALISIGGGVALMLLIQSSTSPSTSQNTSEPGEADAGTSESLDTDSRPPSDLDATSSSDSRPPAPSPNGTDGRDVGLTAPESTESSTPSSETSPRDESPPTAGEVDPRDVGMSTNDADERATRRSALKSAVDRAVEQVEPQLRECYNQLIDDFPESDGTVATTFKLHSGNREVDVAFINRRTTLLDQKLHKCFLENVNDLSVNVPWEEHFADTGTLAINYAFQFKPPSRPDTGR